MPRRQSQKAARSPRAPRQERSRALVEAILDATADILRTEGLSAATTTRIAARAGVSVGSLYQYFPNRIALYRALGERFFGRIDAAAEAMVPMMLAAPPRQALEMTVQGILATALMDPVLDRILHMVAISRSDFEPVASFEARQEARLAAILEARRAELPDPQLDTQMAAQVLVRAMGGIIASTCAREPAAVGGPRLLAEVTALVSRYLGFAPTGA